MKTKLRAFSHPKLLSVQLTLWFTVCFALRANANEPQPADSKSTMEQESGVKVRKDARGRKVQYVDFGEALIEGKAKTPDGFVIQSRTSGKFESLIELRKDFRDKISLNAIETMTLTTPGD
jgi:hypothetical protein